MSSFHLHRLFGAKLGFASAAMIAMANWVSGQESVMSGISPDHPDSDLQVKARWERLAILDLRLNEITARDDKVSRLKAESVQLLANGWGVIVKPNGAVALVRRQNDGAKPLAFFAPEGTVDFRKLCVALSRASDAKTEKGTSFLGGFRIKGDKDVAFARINDLAIWNAVIAATAARLENNARAQLASVTQQFPMQLEAKAGGAK